MAVTKGQALLDRIQDALADISQIQLRTARSHNTTVTAPSITGPSVAEKTEKSTGPS